MSFIKKPFLTVVILAKNEEQVIEDCLKSVRWADELVLIDSGSTDKTIEVAKKYGAVIKKINSQGKLEFARWRNEGIKMARGKWVLYLDADERITPGLKKELLGLDQKGEFTAFEVPRVDFWLGQEVHFGGAVADLVKRLFLRESFGEWRRDLHEDPVFKGKMGRLKNHLEHYTHRDLTSMMEKTIKWTKIEADLLYQANHPPVVWWRFFRMMLTKFWERVIVQQAWRDGTVGWINALFEVFNTFIIYARLWERQNEENNNKT